MVRLMMVALLAAAATLVSVRPAKAMASSCTQDLLGCYARASQIDSWLDRWAAGMDCELDYAGCVGSVISGS
jgi:hypothetical protein